MKTLLSIGIPLTLLFLFAFESKNKYLGKLSDKIVWVGELVLYCFTLPLILGGSWLIIGAVSEILDVVYYAALGNKPVYYGVSVIAGICLKIWVNRRK